MSQSLARIAVFRTCALGDAVQCTPLLRQIRADVPEARLTFFTSDNVAPLLADAPFVDEVVPLPSAWLSRKSGRRGLWRAWWTLARRGPFDALISLEPTWMHNLGSVLVRTPIKAGLRFTEGRKPFELFTHPWRVTGDPRLTTVHASQQYLQLWQQATGHEDRGFGYDVRHLPGAVDSLPTELSQPFMAIAPGTGNVFRQVSTKQWGASSFVELGRALIAGGWRVVYLGGANDLEGHEPPAGALNLLGKTTIREAATVIHSAAALCGNDSGLFHLAQGLGCPAVGIFGQTSPRFTGVFRSDNAVALQAPLPCAGCYQLECLPPADVQSLGLPKPCCMAAVSPAQVMEALTSLARSTFIVPQP